MMHKSDVNNSEKCSGIQDQILEVFESHGNPDDYPDIIEHLNHCDSCKHLYNSILSIDKHLKDPPAMGLKADPQIQKNIVNYLQLKKRIHPRRNEKLVDWIKSIFTIRIPIYQALSGLAVLMILFVFLSGIKNSRGFWWMEIDYSGKTETYENSNLYILDTLHLLNTSNGQNALEDSILVSFLESSL